MTSYNNSVKYRRLQCHTMTWMMSYITQYAILERKMQLRLQKRELITTGMSMNDKCVVLHIATAYIRRVLGGWDVWERTKGALPNGCLLMIGTWPFISMSHEYSLGNCRNTNQFCDNNDFVSIVGTVYRICVWLTLLDLDLWWLYSYHIDHGRYPGLIMIIRNTFFGEYNSAGSLCWCYLDPLATKGLRIR